MRNIKVITVVFVAGMLSACDDSIVIDLVPDANGYLWMSLNYEDDPTNRYLESDVYKYDLTNQRWIVSYDTPFLCSYTYDMACGNGRAWVYGAYWDSVNEWFEPRIWEVGTEHNEAFWGGGGTV